MEISNNFREKLWWNAEEMLEIFGALLKICPEMLQSLIRHYLRGLERLPNLND